jgi:hypothetical protein
MPLPAGLRKVDLFTRVETSAKDEISSPEMRNLLLLRFVVLDLPHRAYYRTVFCARHGSKE